MKTSRRTQELTSVFLIGLMLVASFPFSSAGNVQEEKKRAAVDINVSLTRLQISLLSKSSAFITDTEVRHLIRDLIIVVSKKGVATSHDIQGILHRFGNRFDVRTGVLTSEGEGIVLCFPGALFSMNSEYTGPVCLGVWAGEGITIAGSGEYQNCRGWCFGFLGRVEWDITYFPRLNATYSYRMIRGVSCLIIIEPYT